MTTRWNHNLHLHPLLLSAVPRGCRRALDVGCGEGMLTRELAPLCAQVIGIDLHEPSIATAHGTPLPNVEYRLGDFMRSPFEAESFDFIASVAALHHMPMADALERMKRLLAPGGVLCVLGLARSRSAFDFAVDLAGAVATRAHKLRKSYWEHSAPIVWPPPLCYREVRAIARELLPGHRYRRHVMWRYSLVWNRPGRA